MVTTSESDAIADEIYKYENDYIRQCSDMVNRRCYIGTCFRDQDKLIADIFISAKLFFKFKFTDISLYVNIYGYLRNHCGIHIMQLCINDDVYNVVLKTHWIRLIQRKWKSVFIQRNIVIKIRKSIYCQNHFERCGRYVDGANYMPSLLGILRGI